jgi:hypothetical protein
LKVQLQQQPVTLAPAADTRGSGRIKEALRFPVAALPISLEQVADIGFE